MLPVEAGDLFTGIVGLAGIAVGAVVTVLVNRRQSKDARAWEHMRDDFKAFMVKLDEIESICRKADKRPLGPDEVAGLDDLGDSLVQIADRYSPKLQSMAAYLRLSLRMIYNGACTDDITLDFSFLSWGDQDGLMTHSEEIESLKKRLKVQIADIMLCAAQQARHAYMAVHVEIPNLRAMAKSQLG